MNANPDNRPLKELIAAATAAKTRLELKYMPSVVQDEAAAFRIADGTKAGTVMLGENAFWVVCLADAARLENAGYEWAPHPAPAS